MKIEQLHETPLPSDWDKSVYTPKRPFKLRVDYAKERAERVGTGSSRIAFLIEYQGRPTVLKIAKNQRGMAQNAQEVSVLHDTEVLGYSGIAMIPMIDYDEDSSTPTWIHTEFANEFDPRWFFQRYGFTFEEMIAYAGELTSNRSLSRPQINLHYPETEERVETIRRSEYANLFAEMVGNLELDLNDLFNHKNWGVYQNNPVVLDIGLTTEIYKQYYQTI